MSVADFPRVNHDAQSLGVLPPAGRCGHRRRSGRGSCRRIRPPHAAGRLLQHPARRGDGRAARPRAHGRPPEILGKIGFDLEPLDVDGLAGGADGKVSICYEFWIPDTPENQAAVKAIDPKTVIAVGPRAGEIGGGSSGSPKWVRILRIRGVAPLADVPDRQRRDGLPDVSAGRFDVVGQTLTAVDGSIVGWNRGQSPPGWNRGLSPPRGLSPFVSLFVSVTLPPRGLPARGSRSRGSSRCPRGRPARHGRGTRIRPEPRRRPLPAPRA